MILAPLVPNQKAYEDRCEECGSTTDFHLETVVADFKKRNITFRFYCSKCREKCPSNKSIWRRIVVSEIHL